VLAELEGDTATAAKRYGTAAQRWRALECAEEEARALLAVARLGSSDAASVERAYRLLAALGMSASAAESAVGMATARRSRDG
jgi:hypothetical protein